MIANDPFYPDFRQFFLAAAPVDKCALSPANQHETGRGVQASMIGLGFTCLICVKERLASSPVAQWVKSL